jgi:TM2 domain-containing membrane protein YozV
MLASIAMLAAATGTILWLIAVVLVIAGIVQLVQGQVVAGIVLIVLGALVGPGGVSIFT